MNFREELENTLIEFLDDEVYGTDHYTDKIISKIEKRAAWYMSARFNLMPSDARVAAKEMIKQEEQEEQEE